jgi:hypothetical protein
VQYVDRAFKLRDVQDPERSRFIAYPNLLHAVADAAHWFPVVGLTPALYLIELKSGLAPRRTRKLTKIVQCRASEFDRLHILNIQNIV